MGFGMKEALCRDLTIEKLNAFDVISVQREAFSILVHGIHESVSDAGVFQAEGMAKLMGCHQKQAITWNIAGKTLLMVH